MSQFDNNRRAFLKLTGGMVIGFSIMGISGCEFNSVEPITTGETLPFLTPLEKFYYKNGADISIAQWALPIIDASTWKLLIDGVVTTPQTVSYADIIGATSDTVHLLKTMRCVIDSNEVQGLIHTAVWTGVPLRKYLDRAGVNPSKVQRLRLYGADGFTNNIPISRVYGTPEPGLIEPLLVTHVNGNPLPTKHGYPVRLIIHESFGYKNVKWLSRIEATSDNSVFGTYQEKGFADDGVMRVVSRITDPLDRLSVPAGLVQCVGFAVSGAEGISAVEISVDGNPFVPTTLRTQSDAMGSDPLLSQTVQALHATEHSFPYRGVWAQWSHQFTATTGPHTISIRATDRAGNVQQATDATISDGVNAIPTITIQAV